MFAKCNWAVSGDIQYFMLNDKGLKVYPTRSLLTLKQSVGRVRVGWFRSWFIRWFIGGVE